ncbi:unnamed protein product [Urochloa decumbens]|uniref:Uncharacterized protein n=1 Tax=Urochloa decumbens TaxID=240449 RepID=A0ABC9H8F3_9POAL
MAHYQQGQHGQPATRVDEYDNSTPGGHGVQGQAGGYGAGSYDDAGGYGQQAGYGPTGTGTHGVGGYGSSGHPAYGATGTGVHDAGGLGGYGIHDSRGVAGGHAGTHGVTGTGTHGTGYGTQGATGRMRLSLLVGVLGGGGLTSVPGTTGHGATHVTGTHGAATGAAFPHATEHKTGGILRRSGSSSSSSLSSEDDGKGDRRKKGLVEKIKEKMPGGHKENQGQAATGAYSGTTGYTRTTGTGTTGGTYAPTTGGPHEKKGVMEKIKEKLPGSHKDHDQLHTTATGGYTDTFGRTTTQETLDKKGFMEKVKRSSLASTE